MPHIAVVIPTWRQGQFLAGAVRSALEQEIASVVIVNDGCPEPETDRVGQALRDADPDRVIYLRQPNLGVSAARNAAIRLALRRWPDIDAVFPLDADNLLSPHTLGTLWELLEGHPEMAWASPALEFFGAEQGEWQVPGPFLPYRQMFMNQCDSGSLIRRSVFDSGLAFDQTVRYGFEDWEFFLNASLQGLRGLPAGRCGFRYRRRPQSMLLGAEQRAELLEAEIRQRHEHAFEPGALARREHAEAPRFALVLCDRGEVLLTAACDLEPRTQSVAEYARSIAATARDGNHIPAVTIFTSSGIVEQLGALAAAAVLSRLQAELKTKEVVGLRTGSQRDAFAAIAVRATSLGLISSDSLPYPRGLVEMDIPSSNGLAADEFLATGRLAAGQIGRAIREAGPLAPLSHTIFFEHRHLNERQTTYPWSTGSDRRR
jgi:hypothetical protein